MNKLQETLGFLEMLKGLNKTKVEIDLIMPMLEEATNNTPCIGALPDEGEMQTKRHKEYSLAIKNVESIESGSFYSGFRRCWKWLKSYELVEDIRETTKKQLLISGVVQQSEQLICTFELGVENCGFKSKDVFTCKHLRKCDMCAN